MKRLLTLIALSAVAAVAAAQDKPLDPVEQVKAMQRGVNIVGFDPLWNDPDKARFQSRHMKIIKDGGFDHVRIVLHAYRHMDHRQKLSAQWFATLNRLVGFAVGAGLHVVLDEHDFEFCSRDAAGCRTRLLAFWGQVAPRYKDASNKVMFEILNEPNQALNEQWNALLVETLALIRKTNPTRNVIIGAAGGNNPEWLDKLELPADDRHIIGTVHYYQPMKFTHQGAPWTAEYVKLSGVNWGAAQDRAALDRDFDAIQAWSKQNDRPILLGEFGVFEKAPIGSRVTYLDAVTRGAEKRGWAWSYWQFDGDFIVYNIDKDAWVEPIHRALVPNKTR